MNPKNDMETPGKQNATNSTAISEHSWRVAHIAAILSARLPLHRPPDNSEAWHEGEHSPLDIASPVHDQDFMSCLDRANFLLNNVPGAGAKWVFAEDLFPPRARLSHQGIAKIFKEAGWPKLTSPNTIGNFLSAIREEGQQELRRVKEQRRNDPRLYLLQELELELLPAIAPNFEAYSIFALSRKLGIKSDRLKIEREKLDQPPPPRLPEPKNPEPWINLLKSHYHHLLGVKAPWSVADVVSSSGNVTVTLEHEARCPKRPCDEPCEKVGPAEINGQVSFPVASSYIYVKANRYRLSCTKHHSQNGPAWPSCCEKMPR